MSKRLTKSAPKESGILRTEELRLAPIAGSQSASPKQGEMLTSSFSTNLETVLREITVHAEAQCSVEEIAAITGVPVEQFETDKAKEILARASASGRAKLRKALFARAVGGVDDMMMPIAPQKEVAVWLSKQYLDMKDKQEVKQDGEIKLILERI